MVRYQEMQKEKDEYKEIHGTTKEGFKKALEEKRIIITGSKYTKDGWTGFRVYEIKNNEPHQIWGGSNWNKKDGMYRIGGYGLSRTLEVVLGIGYELGLKFHEIKQNYQFLS